MIVITATMMWSSMPESSAILFTLTLQCLFFSTSRKATTMWMYCIGLGRVSGSPCKFIIKGQLCRISMVRSSLACWFLKTRNSATVFNAQFLQAGRTSQSPRLMSRAMAPTIACISSWSRGASKLQRGSASLT